MNQRGLLIGIGAIAAVAVISALVLFFMNRDGGSLFNPEDASVCTLEVKLCPDGLYVGRVAPSCEFASCSSGAIPSATENSSDDSGVDIKY